jgi:ABC-2 type transport system permease protein
MSAPFRWSVRRELWEHREVFLAPLAVAGLVLGAVLLSAHNLPANLALLGKLEPARQQGIVVMPFSLSASIVLLVSFAIGAYYCFDALNAERRDRSILFWKSMPVSDAIAVLAKAFVPLAVQPAVGFAVALGTQAVLAAAIAVGLWLVGVDVGRLWAMVPAGPMTAAMLYGVVIHVLWYAPLYALFMLLSGWVRRPFLWVLVPAIAAQLLEKLAFGTSYSGAFLRHRLLGAMSEGFAPGALHHPVTTLAQLEPVRFLSSPGLWLGILFAAGCLYAAIRLRCTREPL